ncbi:MAG: hypothetical protein QM757_10210 [Paludibaculum sp.]
MDREFKLLETAKAKLEAGEPLRAWELEPADEKLLRWFQFLSQKPILLVMNLGEADASTLPEKEAAFRDQLLSGKANAELCAVCGKIEAELAELSPEEAAEYMTSYGLPGSSLGRLINVMYRLLGLMSFLTAGETEVRAWTIPDQLDCREGRRRHPLRLREEVHPRRSRELADAGRPERLRRPARERPTAPGRQGVHRQGRRCTGDPPQLRRTRSARRWGGPPARAGSPDTASAHLLHAHQRGSA